MTNCDNYGLDEEGGGKGGSIFNGESGTEAYPESKFPFFSLFILVFL